MKFPFQKDRSEDWAFGALLASVIVAAAGLQGAWVREARPAVAAAHAPAVRASQATVVAIARASGVDQR